MNTDPGQPLIFNIHHFALDDGPGIRTTVFFKGCPLSCIWCHNPESISPSREIAFHPKLCIRCGDCVKACPENAISLHDEVRIERNKCSACGCCAVECPSTALRIIGEYYPLRELVDVILKDRVFYETSKGGVTFSGGEPTLHSDYLRNVMQELKKNNIHIALQTSGVFHLNEFRSKLLPFLDLIYYDIKLLDPGQHRKFTGKDNKRVLDNYVRLKRESDTEIIPRIPLIPGISATKDNLNRIAEFLGKTGCTHYEMLPYNSGGIGKIGSLGKTVPQELACLAVSPEREKECREYFDALI